MYGQVEHDVNQPVQDRQDLAAELRALIRSMGDEPSAPVSDEPQTGNVTDHDTGPEQAELSELIRDLRGSIEETNAELILAVRLMRDLMRASMAELADHLTATEQGVRGEISRLETQLRSDIAALRRDLALYAGESGLDRSTKPE